MKARSLWVALAVLAAPALAQDKPCPKPEATKAEKAIERVNDFAQMRKAWADYKHCDSGQVSELYTETFVRLIVDWKDVDGLANAAKDEGFKAFMYKHLKDPAAKDDLESVFSRAKASCPAKHADFCAELAEFANKALK